MKVDVRMFLFSEAKLKEHLWDEVQSPAGDYSQVKRSKQDNSWEYGTQVSVLMYRNTRERLLEMRRVRGEGYCMIKREYRSCLL